MQGGAVSGRDLISKRTRNEFRETLVGWTLREIDIEFENEDFSPDLNHDPQLSGQRRALVEQYYNNIDFAAYEDVVRFVRVYESVIQALEPYNPEQSKKLKAYLLRDSVGVENGRFVVSAVNPGDQSIAEVLTAFDTAHVHAAWQKALSRRASDPEGAITTARSLLETVCKHVLDETSVPYDESADLPKLWNLCAEELNLAPSQHDEKVFKAILGNCQSVVNHLAAIRNRISDAHGQGRKPVKPKPRHAELAVNLAGTMAAFLVATWQDRQKMS